MSNWVQETTNHTYKGSDYLSNIIPVCVYFFCFHRESPEFLLNFEWVSDLVKIQNYI